MIAVSRAPYNKIDAYKKRMGWNFKWVSSFDTDFNFDYHVSFTNRRVRKERSLLQLYNVKIHHVSEQRRSKHLLQKFKSNHIFHTYSAYSRGIDIVNTAYNYLDLVPKGRDETWLSLSYGVGSSS